MFFDYAHVRVFNKMCLLNFNRVFATANARAQSDHYASSSTLRLRRMEFERVDGRQNGVTQFFLSTVIPINKKFTIFFGIFMDFAEHLWYCFCMDLHEKTERATDH